MSEVQTVSIAVASTSVFLAAIYYILQIRHQTRLRETDLLIRLFSIATDRELQKDFAKVSQCEYGDYGDFVQKYGSISDEKSEVELKKSFSYVINLGELLGLLLKRKVTSIDFLYDVFGSLSKGLWEKVKPIVEGTREESGNPRIGEYFEYLYNEMKKKEQKLK